MASKLQVFLPPVEGKTLLIPYLVFNSEGRRLEPKQDTTPLILERLMEISAKIQKASLHSLAVLRFHSTQKLTGKIQGPTLPFLLQIGNRTPAALELYDCLRLLTNSAVCRRSGDFFAQKG